MDTLQEQLRQLAGNPDFIAQFLHEGAYVFPSEQQLVKAEEQQTASASPALEDTRAMQFETSLKNQHTTAKTESTSPNASSELDAAPVLPSQPAEKKPAIPAWFGKVVILLPPEPSIREVQLLHKILAASSVTDDQVFLQEKRFAARGLGQFEGSRIVLSFGAVEDFKPDYQLRSKAITAIMADSLTHIEANVDAKKKLWAAMKSFFS